MKIYNLTTPEKNEKTGKSYWHTIGTLFAKDDVTNLSGASIKLHMHPELVIKVYPREEKKPRPDEGGF